MERDNRKVTKTSSFQNISEIIMGEYTQHRNLSSKETPRDAYF